MHQFETPKNLDTLWEESKQSSFIQRIKGGESAQDIISSQLIESEGLRPNKTECSDGRCPHERNEFSAAGGGAFYSEELFTKMLERNPGITVITTHDGCGAANLYFGIAQKDGTVPEGVTTAAEYAAYCAQEKATKHGLTYQHISAAEFVAPEHHERGVVMDLTGYFHYRNVSGMPNMFISQTASVDTLENAVGEVSVLTGIGTGEHAFGDRLTKEDPFIILVAAKDSDQLSDARIALATALEKFGDKILIEGFIVPTSLVPTT